MNIVVERNIELKESQMPAFNILLKIEAPQLAEAADGDWVCKYSIVGGTVEILQEVYGIDSMQAMIHALIGIRAHLDLLRKKPNTKLTWLGMDNLGITMDNLMG